MLSSLTLRSLIIALLLNVLPAFTTPARAASQIDPPTCTSTWFVSWGGVSPFELLWTDPDNIPVQNLRFNAGYHDTKLTTAVQGYLDFDGDGKSDVFSTTLRPDGALQWRYWDSNSAGWVNLTYAYDPLNSLKFGDFNGDGKSDVFSTALRQDGNYQWRYSPGGTGSYINLAYASVPPDELRLGDFNGDSKTDVFTSLPQPTGGYWWVYSPGGSGNFVQLDKPDGVVISEIDSLLFGDGVGFPGRGDQKTDVFLILPFGIPGNPGMPLYSWISFTHAEPFYAAASGGTDLSQLRLGNFNGDLSTDVFFQTALPDGSWQWKYISGADYLVRDLFFDEYGVENLHFGDFNGDRLTDVLKVVRNCPLYLPLTTR